MNSTIYDLYKLLYDHFGPQHWWPGRTRFEIIVGAILTQNTAWANVEKAIANLRRAGRLSPKKMRQLSKGELASLIRPAGYFNIKAERLNCFLDFFFTEHKGNFGKMFSGPAQGLRTELLKVKGIGPETADSIILYAGGKPVFVVDAYTKRTLSRHGILPPEAGYAETQDVFVSSLVKSARLFNEYHALFVALGKNFCRPRPDCGSCPARLWKPSRINT